MIKLGSKIKFKSELRRYTVMATNERYVVCTKAFCLKKTVLYTIIDFKQNIRGTENLLLCRGFETQKQCEDALGRLISGRSEISHRNQIALDIEKIYEIKD